MIRYGLVKDGIIINIVLSDKLLIEEISRDHDSFVLLENDPKIKIGDSYDGRSFTPNAVDGKDYRFINQTEQGPIIV